MKNQDIWRQLWLVINRRLGNRLARQSLRPIKRVLMKMGKRLKPQISRITQRGEATTKVTSGT